MKKLLFIFFLSVCSASVFSQLKIGTIKIDPNYKGVKVYSGNGYSGSATTCLNVGQSYTFPNGIGSVKVYGPYKLEHQNGSVNIEEDDPQFNGSGSGTWTLRKTATKYYGIAYSSTNFGGQATYLKLGRNENIGFAAKSLKTGYPAKIGFATSTGYGPCWPADRYSTCSQDVARVDISLQYSKCSSVLMTTP
ncbi:MAG: hypothetical protein KDC80_12255, partial [Saprospiraceae bacterium]|nr:hypothetical protein [Saprospiraceae bacterium]